MSRIREEEEEVLAWQGMMAETANVKSLSTSP